MNKCLALQDVTHSAARGSSCCYWMASIRATDTDYPLESHNRLPLQVPLSLFLRPSSTRAFQHAWARWAGTSFHYQKQFDFSFNFVTQHPSLISSLNFFFTVSHFHSFASTCIHATPFRYIHTSLFSLFFIFNMFCKHSFQDGVIILKTTDTKF